MAQADTDGRYVSRTDLVAVEDNGYHHRLRNRQIRMIAMGGAIGTGLGAVRRPAYRLPDTPVTNYLTIAFLVVVYALSWSDVPAGRVMIYGSAVVAVFLVVGWFVVRGRVRALAAEPLPS